MSDLLDDEKLEMPEKAQWRDPEKALNDGSRKLVEGTKPVNPLLWNSMLIIGLQHCSTCGKQRWLLHLKPAEGDWMHLHNGRVVGVDIIITTMFAVLCILDTCCKMVNGKLPFSSASCVLVTEITKLVLSISFYAAETHEKSLSLPPFSLAVRFAAPFAVPAVLYALNNNLGIHIQLHMDPATYQVLSNLKILSTAILYRIIIKRTISWLQWFSLGMLVSAGVCNSYGGLMAKPGETSAGVIHITVTGLFMISCYSFISGLSGVYTEYILKGKYENSLLYVFGIILNGGVWLFGVVSGGESWNLFEGYSAFTWLLVFSQAVIGLVMSAIMKHANNITRLFLISCAMLVTTVLSVLVFELQLNVYFCSAFVLVLVALYLYHQT